MGNSNLPDLTKKDYSISLARFIAMCFIILCHIMQRDDFSTQLLGAKIEWAWWFNVGVQIFLFISGYLYGKKDINVVEFYKKVFKKILIDYYIFIIVIIFARNFLSEATLNNKQILGLLIVRDTITGLGHLWFVKTILFCYLITPILSEIIRHIDKKNSVVFALYSVLLLILLQIVIMIHFTAFIAPWIVCYAIGMIYSRIENKRGKTDLIFKIIAGALAILMVGVQFKIDYFSDIKIPVLMEKTYLMFCRYGHVFLGISILFIIRALYNKFAKSRTKHVFLDLSDKYSYDIYLVHQIFLLGPFACVEYINNRLIAIPVAMILIAISAFILRQFSNGIAKVITFGVTGLKQRK